ncbi:MAG TPA: MFS transporter [Mycobacteriales bacterium]|nr:MFS transporter [Mycobacteriales bacterium]
MSASTPDPRRWKALALLCVAAFMVILDASIVTVAVPSIEKGLDFSAGGVQWVLTAYVVTFGGLLLFGGRAADLLGRRRVFMAGVGLFALASLWCGLAGSAGMLIAARGVQGVAAAVMTPAAFSILLAAFPEGAERNKAIGVWGAVSGVGGTAGSLIGGPLTDGLGWEWIFFINVPVGIGLLALSPVLLSESRGRMLNRGMDLAGAVLITAALMLLIYGVAQAPAYGLTGGRTVGSLAGSLLLVGVFIGVESRSAAPLVPLGIFASRSLVAGNVIGLAGGMAAFGQGYVLTQYGQQVLGWSAARFGLMTAVLPVLAVAGSIIGQQLVTRWGARPVAVVSMSLLGVACLAWTQLTVGGNYVGVILPGLVIFGPGLGAGCTAGSIAAVAGVSQERSGLASGINNAAFQIGGALGVALLSTVAVSHASGPGGSLAALTHGYRYAFIAAIGFGVLGLAAAISLPGRRRKGAEPRVASRQVVSVAD